MGPTRNGKRPRSGRGALRSIDALTRCVTGLTLLEGEGTLIVTGYAVVRPPTRRRQADGRMASVNGGARPFRSFCWPFGHVSVGCDRAHCADRRVSPLSSAPVTRRWARASPRRKTIDRQDRTSLQEPRQGQTCRKAGTQSHEATSDTRRRVPLCRSGRRTDHP